MKKHTLLWHNQILYIEMFDRWIKFSSKKYLGVSTCPDLKWQKYCS